MTNINAVNIFESLSYINPIYIEQADANRAEPIKPRLSRTVKTLLIAAIIATLLVASALALQAISAPEGNSIGWFNFVMERQGKPELTDMQKDTISALSYSDPVTDEDNGITVTVETLTVGRSSAIMLLSVTQESCRMTSDTEYRFETYECDLKAPEGGPTSYGFSQSFYYTDEDDNKAYIVISLDANESMLKLAEDTETLQMEFENLQYRNTEIGETGCIEGHWQLPVVLSASDVLAPIELGNMSVRAYAYYTWPVSFQLPCRMKLKDVSITSADITYRYDPEYMQMLKIVGKPVGMRMFSISAVLKNGNSISTVGGSDYMDIDGLMVANYRWEVPFSLDDLDYIRFGNSKVLINR